MPTETQTSSGRSPLLRLLLLALTFAAGYVLGARSGEESEWEQAGREPTRITIDDEDGEDGETDE